MEDSRIIELYEDRDENAITESRKKYGRYCGAIAYNILHCTEDAEECVNDTWMSAWDTIPPRKPVRLSVYLGRITRNLALDRYRRDKARKHSGGQTALCLDELGECIGEGYVFEDRLVLKDLLDGFLRGLTNKQKDVFLLRYWYFCPLEDIAARYGMTVGAVKSFLGRIRKKFKDYMERNGVTK